MEVAPDREYLRRLCSDFGFFMEELWRDRNLSRVAPLSFVELDMGRFAANGPKLRGILGPRGVGKSHIVAGLACYRFRRDPNRKVLTVSKSHPHAKRVLHLIRSWIDNVWFLQDLRPGEDQDDSKTQFQLGPSADSLQPSMTALGIDGQLEGNRAHTIIPDDIETEKNTETPDAREALDERVKEFVDILYPDRSFEDGGPLDPTEVIYIGTYHTEESTYLKLSGRGYAFRTWPIAYPTPEEKVLNLAPMLQERLATGKSKPGEPVFPHRFGPENMLEKQAEGRTRYAMQHMLICDLGRSNRYPLKLADLMTMPLQRDLAPVGVAYATHDHDGSTVVQDKCHGFSGDRLHRPVLLDKEKGWAPYTGTKAWIDPSGRGDDLTGLGIVGHLNGRLFLKHSDGLEGGAAEHNMDELVRRCRLHGATEIYVETNIDTFNTYSQLLEQAVFRHFLEPGADPMFPGGWKAIVIPVHSTGQKETRILAALEPVMSTHRMVVDPSCLVRAEGQAEKSCLQYQLTRITRQRHALAEDGEIDAIAGCVSKWQDELRLDPDRGRLLHEERQTQARMEVLLRLVRPGQRAAEARPPAWFHHLD